MHQTLDLVDETLAGTGVSKEEVADVVLVGGSTRIPYVRAALAEHLRAPVNCSLDPVTVVARGAALRAAIVLSETSIEEETRSPAALLHAADLERSVRSAVATSFEFVKKYGNAADLREFKILTDELRAGEPILGARAMLNSIEALHMLRSRILGRQRLEGAARDTAQVVETYGDTAERREFEALISALRAAKAVVDERAMRTCVEGLDMLRSRILFKQDWIIRDLFQHIKRRWQLEKSGSEPAAVKEWVMQGERAVGEHNSAALREAVIRLFSLWEEHRTLLEALRLSRAGSPSGDDRQPRAETPGSQELATHPRVDSDQSLQAHPSMEPDMLRPCDLIENAQFTVYRPRVLVPEVWTTLLAFAHLSERPGDVPNRPDPLKEVERIAEQTLGTKTREYTSIRQDSSQSVPRSGKITFVPEVRGLEFNPRQRTFAWVEDVHCEQFRLRGTRDLLGQTTRGQMAVFLGSVLIAEVALSFQISNDVSGVSKPPEVARARPYRKIFASYSHRDKAVVEEFERCVRSLGDEYLRDVTHIRSGEKWNSRLEEMIRDANIFQLFWSSNSMRSPFVRKEWEYALALQRVGFVKPVYWEEPIPESLAEGLPPEDLRRLHFYWFPGLQPTASPKMAHSEGHADLWRDTLARTLAILAAIILLGWLMPTTWLSQIQQSLRILIRL